MRYLELWLYLSGAQDSGDPFKHVPKENNKYMSTTIAATTDSNHDGGLCRRSTKFEL